MILKFITTSMLLALHTLAFSTPVRIQKLATSYQRLTRPVHQTITSHQQKSRLKSTLNQSVWYSDPNLSRSNVPGFNKPDDSSSLSLIDNSKTENLRFVLMNEGKRGVQHLVSVAGESAKIEKVKPLFLTYDQIHSIMGEEIFSKLLVQEELKENEVDASILWIGDRDDKQYWAIYNKLMENEFSNSIQNSFTKEDMLSSEYQPKFLQLREFGDRIPTSEDAAIHSTANGLIEFHLSHKYCSKCGSSTSLRKAGASRLCSNHKSMGGSCSAPSVYPRIDVASIMLITSPCEKYALLGRKASWPKGRYSTLAGFLEVGETVEQCCVRETFEESGVHVDRNTITFLKSQPWLFPRSLMVGFRAKALVNDRKTNDGDHSQESSLPCINFDEIEMEDVQWFHRDFVAERLDGGSTALLHDPTDEEKEFHIPGKASLARMLITSWALEK
mmetsp:Transcript_6820/g.7413  ORF Transcript_6820/g.7413 Transcript_6820/m.7413 type:complete len:444 (+) Transcript_6820:79-1410(+)